MNGSVQKAADDIISLANKFKPLFGAAEELQKLGNLAQVEREFLERKDRAEKACGEAEEKLAEYAEQVKSAAESARENQKQSNGILEAANKEAAQIIYLATEKAAKIVSESDKKRMEVQAMSAVARKEVDLAEEKCEEARKELAKLNRQIEEARSKIAAFMRG